MDQRSQQLAGRLDVKLTDYLLVASHNYLTDDIEGITRGATTVIQLTGHGFAIGDEVYFEDVGGTVELNGTTHSISAVATNTITLALDSSGYGAWTSGGTVIRGRLQRCTINDLAEFFATVAQLDANQTADRDRANHTGTQTVATLSDYITNTEAIVDSYSGVEGGYAPLDSGEKIPQNFLPALALTDVFTVASQAAQLALTAQEGDVVVRTDNGRTYIHNGGAAGTMADYSEIQSIGQVSSVNGMTGAVTGLLVGTNNLSDIGNAATARTNLGLGSAATRADSYFITSANPFLTYTAEGHPGPEQVRTNLGWGDMVYYNASQYSSADLVMSNKTYASPKFSGTSSTPLGTFVFGGTYNFGGTPKLVGGTNFDVSAAGAVTLFGSLGANNLTLAGSTSTVVIPGNLQVNGTTVVVNTTNMDVKDKNITVNDGGNDASSEGAGLTVERTGTNGSLIYGAAYASKWAIGNVGSEKEVADLSSNQTFTNKSMSAALNTIAVTATGLTATALNAALLEIVNRLKRTCTVPMGARAPSSGGVNATNTSIAGGGVLGGTAVAEDIPVTRFADSAVQTMDFLYRLNGYNGGGLTVSLPFFCSAITGNVFWLGEIRRLGNGTTVTAAFNYAASWNTVAVTVANATGKIAYGTMTFTNGSDMDNLADGEYFILRIVRDATPANVSDTAAGAADLMVPIIRET